MLLGNLEKLTLWLLSVSVKFLLLLFRDSLWNMGPWRAVVSLSSKSVELPSTIKASLFSLRLIAVMTHMDLLRGQTRCVRLSILKAGNAETCTMVNFATRHCLAWDCKGLVSMLSIYRRQGLAKATPWPNVLCCFSEMWISKPPNNIAKPPLLFFWGNGFHLAKIFENGTVKVNELIP